VIPALADKDHEDPAIMIHGPPEDMHIAVEPDEHLVQTP
jgi:hypothetical protein